MELRLQRPLPSSRWLAGEVLRLLLVAGGSLGVISAFVTPAVVGSGDATWYSLMASDFMAQWRARIFPVFVGQTEYAFNGSVNPLRFAPYFQHLTGVLDLLTGHSLKFVALQNLALVLSVIGGGLSAYFCAAALLPRQRWTAAGLALLYVSCPGVVTLAYVGNLFMTVMALPYVPWVIYALWRSLEPGDVTGAVRTVPPLAAIWWCHAPVAFWLTVLAAAVHVWRLASRWRDPGIFSDCIRAGVLFALCAGYIFISVATLNPPPQPVERMFILQYLRDDFPSVLLPVTRAGRAAGDSQLGWSLWGAWLLSAVVFAWRPRRANGMVLGAAGLFLLFLLPVPGLNRWLWLALPQTVVNITFYNPEQRFYVIIAAAIVVGGAAAIGILVDRFPKAVFALNLILLAGVGWSGSEASHFIRTGFATRRSTGETQARDGLNNIELTRYSFNSLGGVPSYFSHGYIDPYLENRVWAPDQQKLLLDNAAAVRPTDAAPSIVLRPQVITQDDIPLEPYFTLSPGVRYALRFNPLRSLDSGTLLAEGKTVFREYGLPGSGTGMPFLTPERAFGTLPTSRDFFPIWISRPAGDKVQLRYVFAVPALTPVTDASFARVRLQSYDIARLPVKITGWAPYQALLESPVAGAWLETPRLFTSGYRAMVNGRRASVRHSADGRVLVALAAGPNRVVLAYAGPGPLRWSYYAALLTWTLLGLRAATNRSGIWRAPRRALH
jgi:hypothetical protein